MKAKNLHKILKFLHQSENLKNLLRHSWLSSGRQESVAEHSWRVALMAILLAPEIGQKTNLEKVLKMAIFHDLAEIIAGDHHAWKGKLKNKYQKEKSALKKLTSSLPASQRIEILKLWEEYEAKKTKEAKFTKAIDKLETIIQHNQADLSTWTKEEYTYNFVHGKEESKYNPVLKEFKKMIDQEIRQKIASAKQK